MENRILHVDAGAGYDIVIEPGVLDDAGARIKAALPRAKRLFRLPPLRAASGGLSGKIEL